jgi:hypothetical protein
VVTGFTDIAHPGEVGPSKGRGTVFVEVAVSSKGVVESVRSVGGPDELVPVSLQNARQLMFRSGQPRTVTVAYKFDLVDGYCVGHYTATSAQGTLFDVIGCRLQ